MQGAPILYALNRPCPCPVGTTHVDLSYSGNLSVQLLSLTTSSISAADGSRCFHREAAAHCWQAEMKFGTLQGLKNPIDSGAQTV